ncbi:hypothetical protein LDL77_19260 [Flagellimonas marinaquae]|uniref:hypothetical protein n=1 Tax=Flagellimonas aurea TaxID=2915619 RepID=UPI001CE198D5|nr:hypothetical protein LDL77_19260 [Allomuricauda aquimarina]
MKKNIVTLITVIAFVGVSYGQQNNMFDFQIQKSGSEDYEMQLQLFDTSNVQFIEVHFLEQGNELLMEAASLNQKKDGKFYLAIGNDEKVVSPENMVLTFTNDFGMLKEHTIEVRLLDKDFNLLASVSQPVIEF